MLYIRKSEDRGHAKISWLESKHSFSFGEYYDQRFMGYGPLRVINEDYIQPSEGFPMHPHRDMEIITYLIKGELAHKDTVGNKAVITRGEVQRMTAGTGIRHSEYNDSDTERVHMLQIWIEPSVKGLAPDYEQKLFTDADKKGKFKLIVSPNGKDGSMSITQDASLYASLLDKGQNLTFDGDNKRLYWLQLITGSLKVEGKTLKAGDALAIKDLASFKVNAIKNSEFILFDMANTQ